MPVSGPAKGSDFERKICTILSLWVSGLKREDIFWRSSMSGGRANLPQRRSRGHQFSSQSGDISAVHPMGHQLVGVFLIECKFWRSLDLDSCLFSDKAPLVLAWEKTWKQAEEEGKNPLMIVKQNRIPELVITNETGRRILTRAQKEGKPTIRLLATIPPNNMVLFQLRDMINFVDPKKIHG